MATQHPAPSEVPLARAVRERFVTEVDGVVLKMAATAQGRLSALADQPGTTREQQSRRDAMLEFMRLRDAWIQAVLRAWRQGLASPGLAAMRRDDQRSKGLSLLEDDVIENRILVSRLTLASSEKVSWELNDLRMRMAKLEDGRELADRDVLKPDTFASVLVDQWIACGLTRPAWMTVQDSLAPLLADCMMEAYQHANAFLIRNGVLPQIDRKPVVRRSSDATPGAHAETPGRTARRSRPGGPAGDGGGDGDGGAHTGGSAGDGHAGAGHSVQGGAGEAGGGASGVRSGGDGGGFFGGHYSYRGGAAAAGHGDAARGAPSMVAPSGHRDTRSAMADETRMMTSTTPLARARQRAQGMLGQLKRLLGDRGADFDATRRGAPSPALAEALEQERGAAMGGHSVVAGTVMSDAGDVQKLSVELRERTTELKRKASSSSEKAIIEIVALMFQSILAEERLPASVRVWFARLQMPVLRVALAEPEFFGTLQHPARQLIDRMGSCVMGFDPSGVQGSAMEAEIRRVVQVIEQYPETGRRVFQLVLDEFQKFLSRFLTEKDGTQRLVSVAQQVEQKETLAIQYTIELRSMLDKIKVRDEIREFLFKVWAEVLAVAALRHGAQHPETLALKRVATDLLWSASAKPNRDDRARVIQDLPGILHHLRQGMTLLGLSVPAQDAHIKGISESLTDAFLSKTEAIPQEQIDDMARRLEQLEIAISDDDASEIVLDPTMLEVMLGVDASSFEVLANSGSLPSHAMLAWARELELGQWFVLDHNSRVAQVQLVWRSERRQLYLFSASGGNNYLIQARRLAAYLQAGLLVPSEDETLTVRATREALAKLDANPERLLD